MRGLKLRKFFPLVLFIAAILLIGWVGYDYASSGTEVAEFELSGTDGSSRTVELEPGMSPLRLVLLADYDLELKDQTTPAFRYDIRLVGPGGLSVVEEKGQQNEKRDDNTPEYASKSVNRILKTFDVVAPGAYVLDWRIEPVKAKMRRQLLVIRRNVSPLQIPYLILGTICFAGAVLLLLTGRRKNNGSGKGD